MKQYRLICTHNPQDFFNGIEPAELVRSYITSNVMADVGKEIDDGYCVIISEEYGSYADV